MIQVNEYHPQAVLSLVVIFQWGVNISDSVKIKTKSKLVYIIFDLKINTSRNEYFMCPTHIS